MHSLRPYIAPDCDCQGRPVHRRWQWHWRISGIYAVFIMIDPWLRCDWQLPRQDRYNGLGFTISRLGTTAGCLELEVIWSRGLVTLRIRGASQHWRYYDDHTHSKPRWETFGSWPSCGRHLPSLVYWVSPHAFGCIHRHQQHNIFPSQTATPASLRRRQIPLQEACSDLDTAGMNRTFTNERGGFGRYGVRPRAWEGPHPTRPAELVGTGQGIELRRWRSSLWLPELAVWDKIWWIVPQMDETRGHGSIPARLVITFCALIIGLPCAVAQSDDLPACPISQSDRYNTSRELRTGTDVFLLLMSLFAVLQRPETEV